MTEQRYDPQQIEPRWQAVWAQERTWEVSNEPAAANGAPGNGARHPPPGNGAHPPHPKSYVLEMLPYPSGEPHIGHLKVYSVGDALAHFHRRLGHRVLHPMGYDAFGLPAENHAINTGVNPRESTAASIASFQRQFREWGISIDWSRELATREPSYYRWTQWIFLQLLHAGLAYRKEAAVKWCPNDQTVLANEQVVDGCCERCGAEVEDPPAGAVVPAHHRLRRAPAGRPRRDRVAGAREDDAAQLDRALGGRGSDVPLRGLGSRPGGRDPDRLSRVHYPPRHAVRRDLLRDGARAPRRGCASPRAPSTSRRCASTSTTRSPSQTRIAAPPTSRRRAWRWGAPSPTPSMASRSRCTWPTTC